MRLGGTVRRGARRREMPLRLEVPLVPAGRRMRAQIPDEVPGARLGRLMGQPSKAH